MIEQTLPPLSDVRLQQEGHLGCIILDRPKRLNAIDITMASGIKMALNAWKDDPSIHTVLLESSSSRAFCAGGDLRAIYDSVKTQGPLAAYEQMKRVYDVMLQLADYQKPVVSFLDGVAMGGGIGLGGHVRYRVVTERSVLAMPETVIGLSPDAGGSWLLARAPGFSGLRRAVTGGHMNGAEAVAMGFADVLVSSSSLADLKDTLSIESAEHVFAHLSSQPASLDVQSLDSCYDAPDILQVIEKLKADNSEGAQEDLEVLSRVCPFSVQVAWQGWHRARAASSLHAAFQLEENMVRHMVARPDFAEGIRARLIDKDNKPAWAPSTLAEVNMQEVQACFEK
ncbi:enoyl-CoA hydratase/isomerase family protein [Acetobacter pomorum]|uniref:Enoyl-CoA hydratase/isomerase family protein n=1 Tax=Acetobacter pomorum TaxID=65959 RepID=A0A2G4R7R7_9PROT|nr:enoyl-CoA hydratase/isomerase family protein [Acetobacter pomorum]KDE19567.1 3-hydroxyisobutyryl-CoA hydrolase [Acetobacter aceti 1023]PHY92596.1 enoyl-CoA hydratase/isomerase family protein [Acetobacter pomorum]GBR47176.1 3-hydroxyisobutyryl-CoA hydrolase [Acetobacter pomorum DSM 11825]